MANQHGRSGGRRRKREGAGSGPRRSCPYCHAKVEQVDWKDVGMLRRFLSERGRMRPSRTTGACRRHQAQLSRAIKRARELALLPYSEGR